MPDENSLPIPGDHNQPSARAYLHQMRQAAHQFVAGEHASEAHLLSVMECAYHLRTYKEESAAHRDEVGGLLGKEKIADTARLLRSHGCSNTLFTRTRWKRAGSAVVPLPSNMPGRSPCALLPMTCVSSSRARVGL